MGGSRLGLLVADDGPIATSPPHSPRRCSVASRQGDNAGKNRRRIAPRKSTSEPPVDDRGSGSDAPAHRQRRAASGRRQIPASDSRRSDVGLGSQQIHIRPAASLRPRTFGRGEGRPRCWITCWHQSDRSPIQISSGEPWAAYQHASRSRGGTGAGRPGALPGCSEGAPTTVR